MSGRLRGVKPLAIHHVAINVADVEEAIHFYVDVLGLAVRPDRPDFGIGGAWLDAGGQQVHLVQADPAQSLGQHFALLVDDLDGAIADLRSQGVKVSDASGVGTAQQAFLKDPAGNMIEIHQAG
jgi:glyoxylase I family protein